MKTKGDVLLKRAFFFVWIKTNLDGLRLVYLIMMRLHQTGRKYTSGNFQIGYELSVERWDGISRIPEVQYVGLTTG